MRNEHRFGLGLKLLLSNALSMLNKNLTGFVQSLFSVQSICTVRKGSASRVATAISRNLCRKANNTLFHLHASTWTTNCLPNSLSPILFHISVLDTSFRLLSALSSNTKQVVMNVITDRFAAFAFQLSHSPELSSLPHVSH